VGAIQRLLIANRGEIAVRILRACRELGVDSVAVTAPGERPALHAALADRVVEVDAYTDGPGIVAAALEVGADAVHPGYGFLSEQAGFAELVREAGLRWVGPPPEAMRRLGDKIEARALAEAAGVRVVPGSSAQARSEEELFREAEVLGYPVLVKAAAGGGGRGMRPVAEPDALRLALAEARAEAAAAFGDGRVFLERRLEGARHVEIQVLLDGSGLGVHLGERDCSMQRRHQKVVEEAPSPAVTPELREALGEAALAVARTAGYEGAGTAEFLLLPDGTWVFLEMNARLQVEHPVTEAVTGIDLVRAQLRVADGAALPWAQGDVSLRGHAVEARIYAEDPAAGFLPSTGRVELLDLPRWPGVRIDTALRRGDEIGLDYDPLLAKVIAVAEDRTAALARLRAALAEVRIVGVATNLGFLLDALAHPDFVKGHVDTDWVTDVWRPAVPTLPDRVASSDPRDPWRAFAGAAPDREVTVAAAHAQYRGWAYALEDEFAPTPVAPPGGSLTAPMPASVAGVAVGVGDAVATGQLVVVLEAMKMHLRMHAPAAGTVRTIHVHPGDVVTKGQVLLEVEEP
jgi:3-methylcrotonyl-CoA carboxylase alpha subunit